MKKHLFVGIGLGVGILLLAALRPAPEGTPTSESIRKTYIEGLNAYGAAIAAFGSELEHPAATPDNWKMRFRDLRHAYKKIEFLLAYLDDENTRDYLNGPPLPWINRVVAGVEVYQPTGMQITEEHLYADDPAAEKEALVRLVRELAKNYEPIRRSQAAQLFTDREIIEALRAGIFRITTLSLTGFDTPGSGESLAEAAVALQAMQDAAVLYLPYLKPAHGALADSIRANFSGAIRQLAGASDFESFDRLQCIRQHLEPLYGQLLRLHLALGIETVYQIHDLSLPLNYLSPSMFSAETFNDHYYAGIGAREESAPVVELGRMLFFDPILSANNERSCASCHRPELAFTDGLAKSEALNHEGNVGRNAPTLINSVYADKYFYDFRTDRLETQAEHVIFNPKEFNTTYYQILDKLNAGPEYQQLFKNAFGQAANVQGITRALAAYVRSLKGFNSPVDRYLRGEDVQLSAEVQQGFNLFMGKAVCGTCHFAPTYSGLVPPAFRENESEVIGVPANPAARKLEVDPDPGRYANGVPRDRAPHLEYSFKTTTVRNAGLTAPYMHNGVYKTLEEVVDFYNKGGGAGMGIDLPHQTLPFDQLNLTAQEQKALVAFMKILTDTSGMTTKPARLPAFDQHSAWNKRVVGGIY